MIEYRPCIVTETIEKKFPSRNSKRMIDITSEVVEHKALFHCWSERFWIYNPIMIREVGGQMSRIIAVVEYEDGTVHEHFPCDVRFIDGKINDYEFKM